MTVQVLRIEPGQGQASSGPIDPERVLAGNPLQTTENAFSNSEGNFHCGVWSSTTGTWRIAYTEDELCTIIAGNAIITDSQGNATAVQAGDSFVIPSGFRGTWETVGEVRKLYAIHEK